MPPRHILPSLLRKSPFLVHAIVYNLAGDGKPNENPMHMRAAKIRKGFGYGNKVGARWIGYADFGLNDLGEDLSQVLGTNRQCLPKSATLSKATLRHSAAI